MCQGFCYRFFWLRRWFPSLIQVRLTVWGRSAAVARRYLSLLSRPGISIILHQGLVCFICIIRTLII